MADQDRLYFAYGSNLDVAQMRERCPDSRPMHPATLPDYRLVFSGISRRWGNAGSASVMAQPGAEVAGLVYRMPPGDIATLDGYESVPTVYTRQEVRARTPEGESLAVFTYQRLDHTLNPPHMGYFFKIWGGYRVFGLQEDRLFHALREALEAVNDGDGKGRG